MSGPWWTLFGTVFVTVFVAELGDKTQLAAFGLAAGGKHPSAVFFGSAAALILTSAIAVGVGKLAADHVDPRWTHYLGAVLFLAIGVVMLVRGPELPDEAPAPPAQIAAPSSLDASTPPSGD